MLDEDHKFGECVVLHRKFVIGGFKVVEKAMRNREEWHVLNIGVVLG